MPLIVYDCEIAKAIPDHNTTMIPDIEYCEGWGDFAGMGISVISAYVQGEGYRIFMQDNLQEFAHLVVQPDTVLIGFNSKAFDDKLLAANLGLLIQSWDFLERYKAATAKRPSLNDLAIRNGLLGKRGHGAQAPILFQRRRYGALVDYAINDTIQLKKLVDVALAEQLLGMDGKYVLLDIGDISNWGKT